MSPGSGAVRDARTLLGMDTRVAWLLGAFYLSAEGALAITSWQHTHHRWPILLALAITVAATAALIAVRRDPLPVVTTVLLSASIPAASALTLFNLPIPTESSAQTWAFGSGTVTATFLCVRGRAPAAWAGLLSMIGTAMVWSACTGQGAEHGAAVSVINLGPLLMATFFAYTLRPAARAIFALREESTRQAESEAAAAAAFDERRAQTQRLERLVRPILETIAGPAPLDLELRRDCRLVEAHLRDTLRAPALAAEPVAGAAHSARQRGVDVVLVDDQGLEGADSGTRARLLAAVAAELDAVATGATVHVRILPPRRPILATIVVNDPGAGIRRLELGGSAPLPETVTPRYRQSRVSGIGG